MHWTDWIQHHQVVTSIGIYYVFSSMVGALPSPDDKSGKGYKFFCAFMHALAANVMRIPQVRSLVESTPPVKEP